MRLTKEQANAILDGKVKVSDRYCDKVVQDNLKVLKEKKEVKK